MSDEPHVRESYERPSDLPKQNEKERRERERRLRREGWIRDLKVVGLIAAGAGIAWWLTHDGAPTWAVVSILFLGAMLWFIAKSVAALNDKLHELVLLERARARRESGEQTG